MTTWANIKEKIKLWFQKKPDYKEMYDAERRIAESWEYRYNKLYRQLNAILKEDDNG
jgi:hypothetical protein